MFGPVNNNNTEWCYSLTDGTALTVDGGRRSWAVDRGRGIGRSWGISRSWSISWDWNRGRNWNRGRSIGWSRNWGGSIGGGWRGSGVDGFTLVLDVGDVAVLGVGAVGHDLGSAVGKSHAVLAADDTVVILK